VRTIWLVGNIFLASVIGYSQTITISGTVKDTAGEPLPFASVFLSPDSSGTLTDSNAKFSIQTLPGRKQLKVSYTGYKALHMVFNATRDTIVRFIAQREVAELKEAVITDRRYAQSDWIETTRTGTTTLTQEEVNSIPVLGGEADVIKVLQLLPGTVRGVEGSSDLFVRGGAADQNLVLLDDAPIYNTSHLFGFLSVFNPDILQKVESVNGGFPANYGGRLSSVLNVETRSDIAEKTQVSGNVGLIASRLFVEQPIIKDKASVWISGRRTYIDKLMKVIGEDVPYFFYDLNGKIIVTPTDQDNIQLSYYAGKDVLSIFRDRNNDGEGFLTSYKSGNNSQSLKWQRAWTSGWNSSTSLLRTAYSYNILNAFQDSRSLASSDIEDIGMKMLVNKKVTPGIALTFGVDWTRHDVSPSIVNVSGTFAEFFESSSASGRVAHELSPHGQAEWMLAKRWLINTGFRTSMAFTSNKKYIVPEPRISARYKLAKNESVKFSYSRMAQYVHRISNSAISSPTDIWYPVTDSIRPQTSHQVSIAWQKLFSGKVYASVESYYKNMNDIIGFEEGTNLFFTTEFQSKLIQGTGSAYGLEFLVKKETGHLTGWISYTLSWAWRKFDQLNQGNRFPSRYDRRHNGAIVMQYALSKKWSLSAVWEFVSGSRFTPIVGQYAISSPTGAGVDLLPVYAPLNSVRLADTHRLDLGVKFRSNPDKRFQSECFVGVYNAYNRASPIGIRVEPTANGGLKYTQPGLFGTIPFISYGFKF
jgi:CarboxypepD_reg-like domain/TonB-dependent Receptor Plug Domain